MPLAPPQFAKLCYRAPSVLSLLLLVCLENILIIICFYFTLVVTIKATYQFFNADLVSSCKKIIAENELFDADSLAQDGAHSVLNRGEDSI